MAINMFTVFRSCDVSGVETTRSNPLNCGTGLSTLHQFQAKKIYCFSKDRFTNWQHPLTSIVRKINILCKSMAAVSCLVTCIFQNIFFCVQQKKETHRFVWVLILILFSFLGELSLYAFSLLWFSLGKCITCKFAHCVYIPGTFVCLYIVCIINKVCIEYLRTLVLSTHLVNFTDRQQRKALICPPDGRFY